MWHLGQCSRIAERRLCCGAVCKISSCILSILWSSWELEWHNQYMTRLEWSGVWILVLVIDFSLLQTSSGAYPTRVLSLGYSIWRVKLTTHLLPLHKVKNDWSYTSTTPICLHVMVRENLTFVVFRFTWQLTLSGEQMRKKSVHV